jgi:hypothetical protein
MNSVSIVYTFVSISNHFIGLGIPKLQNVLISTYLEINFVFLTQFAECINMDGK